MPLSLASAQAISTAVPFPPRVDPSNRLTLAQAVQIGMKGSPLILASQYSVEAAQANYAGQRSPVNPVAQVSGLNNTVANVNALSDPSNYITYWTIETSGRLQWRTRQAKAQFQGARADRAATVLTVREAVTAAYINLQLANRNLQDEQEAYANAQRLRDLTKKQFDAGDKPETNAIRTEVALTQESANLLTAVNGVTSARSALNLQMGRGPEQPVDAAEPLAYNPIHPKLEDLQAQANRSRPELASAEFNHRALSAAIGLQRAQSYPDLVIGHTYRFDSFNVGVAFPLFDFGSVRGAVQQAQKNVKVQEAQTDQLRKSIQLQVSEAFEALMLAARTVEAYEKGTLPQSESLLQRIERGFTLGSGTILDLIDAQNNLRAVRIAYYGAIGNYRLALSQLEGAVGAPVTALNSAPLQLSVPIP